ncbi:MAG: hypothetical protein AAGD10_04930 [Myxococcota bacterium]
MPTARLDAPWGLVALLVLGSSGCTSESRPASGRNELPNARPVPSREMGPVERGHPQSIVDMGIVEDTDMGIRPPDLGPPPPDLGPLPPAASRPLQFKRFDQLREELGRILDLPAASVCVELGRYSCTDDAHRVVLGGAKAIGANIYWGDSVPGPTTPVAFERVVLSACAQRAQLEVEMPPDNRAFLVAAELVDGGLDPRSTGAMEAVHRLFRGGLLREANSVELEAAVQIYDEISAVNRLDPAMTWFQAICAGVLSSTEFAFY